MSYSCASNRIVSLRRFRFSLQHPVLGLALGALLACFASPASVAAADVGYPLYSTSITGSVTGEKPQSKLWFHAGTWWAILDGPDGVAIYEKSGSNWRRGMFVDAVLASSGEADVKWDGSRLHVLLYANAPKYYEFTYDSSLRVWNLVVGFPVSVPKPSGIETMTMETDSAGRAWATAEGNGNVNVYYTTSADRRTWSSSPIILRSGIGADDITSIIAFGGNKIGVFWSDQNRDEFGFCIHRDSDPPDHWQPMEVASSGAGHADDHLNLAYDSLGRVYAITKDDFDRMTMHRRELDGHWTVKSDVTGASGTRGIVMISEADNQAYILWTDWTTSPDRIVYRKASLGDLRFGSTSTFMSIGASLNNVSGTKQILPAGCLLAIAEGQSKVWWNGWGVPTPVTLPPPTAPKALSAALLAAPARVELDWSRPSSGVPQGYYVYRQLNGGAFARLNSSPMSATNYIDSNPVAGTLGYMVTAFANNQEGPGSAIAAALADSDPGRDHARRRCRGLSLR
jgi:hypothetical protein